ncbi:kelch domain-containing protein 7A [Pelodytes ibericus]
MINTVLESRAWQSDMQLMGKLAFSVSAVFILALAYRFYKSRTPQRLGTCREDAAAVTGEGTASLEAAPKDYVEDETIQLRFRRVHSKLHGSKVTDHDSQHLAGEPPSKQELPFPTQTGLESDTTERKASNDLLRSEAKEWGRSRDQGESQDALQMQNSAEDSCDGEGKGTKRQEKSYREDPEETEMHESLDSGNMARSIQNLQARCDINLFLNQDTQTTHALHQFSSTAEVQLEENFIAKSSAEDAAQAEMHGGVRGKIYNYHVESTSQSLKERNVHAGASPSKPSLAHLKTDGPPPAAEESPASLPGEDGNIQMDHLDLIKQPHKPDKEVQSGEHKPGGEDYVPAVGPKLMQESMRDMHLPPRTATFHVSLNPESSFDIHLDSGNCYEVLSLAKKHNLDFLKAAAYKVMSTEFLKVLQNPSVYGRLNATERDLILDKRLKGRKYVAVADIDTQGYPVSQNSSSISYYDNDNDLWKHLSYVPEEAVSRGCSIATMFNYLFVALGSEGSSREMKPSKRVACYNPLTDSWQDISPLNEARPHCKLVALDGYLYAIGGECLHTVERYDPRQNRWSYVAPLPNDTFAVAHMATACEDQIYVTGGTIRYILLSYRPKENVWKQSIISGSKDRTTDMVAANNFLYRFDLNRRMGISVHRCNIRARIWYECASYPMPYPAPFQCVVINNNIYCVSRNFHLRFLVEDISPRFMDGNLSTLPSPKGVLFPFVLVLPVQTS